MDERGETREEEPAYVKALAVKRDMREGVNDQIGECGFRINFIHKGHKICIFATH